MRRILTYKLFESKKLASNIRSSSLDPGSKFWPEDRKRKIREGINESESELVITDIFSDFTDDHNVAIHFNWGWAIENKAYPSDDSKRYDLRKDAEIKMFRTENGLASTKGLSNYLAEVDKSNIRYVEVSFDKYERGSETLNIWSENLDPDFKKCVEFVKNYFPQNKIIRVSDNINPDIWRLEFSMLFI